MVHGRPKSVVQLDGDLLHELQIDPRNRDLFQSTRMDPFVALDFFNAIAHGQKFKIRVQTNGAEVQCTSDRVA